ncbi:MAG: NADH:flavin oxidoreductase/NADH oxidase [Bifidobacteriaceae bacterium]|nr:NADH:flavin oxidoreductase/NADH oxidase [Bifidobacteriaceae bacterium]
MSRLFTPIGIGPVTARNRLWVSPMCQYSSESMDGQAYPWHAAHYGSLAAGGAGLVVLEATGVAPEGRITPWDLGLWDDSQIGPLASIAAFIKAQGALAGIQLGHAGRKGSAQKMWLGDGHVPPERGGYQTYAPSPIAFGALPEPRELTNDQIADLVAAFAAAAGRAARAGFDVIELHGAHGYLIHQFLSPLSNRRRDRYGGSLENRCRFALEAVAAARAAIGPDRALLLRISATDWVDGGWDLDQSVELVRAAKDLGLDHIDVSTGGLAPDAQVPVKPGYQAPFGAAIRRRAALSTNTVGVIETPEQAEALIADGPADGAANAAGAAGAAGAADDVDAVMLGRPFLRDPHIAVAWATRLGLEPADWCPPQYARAGWQRYYAPGAGSLPVTAVGR